MKIDLINNRTTTSFNAQLQINKSGAKYLTEKEISLLGKKAKEIGLDKDIIYFDVSSSAKEYLSTITDSIIYKNFIRAQFSFLSTPRRSYNTIYRSADGANKDECNKNIFKCLDNALDSIKECYDYEKKNKNVIIN